MASVTYTATKGQKLIGGETVSWLNEVDDTDITNSALMPNPNFNSTDVSWWDSVDGSVSVLGDGFATVIDTGPNTTLFTKATAMIDGGYYQVRVVVSVHTAGELSILLNGVDTKTLTTAGTLVLSALATSTPSISIISGAAGFTGSISLIQGYKAIPNSAGAQTDISFSVFDYTLAVLGNITRTHVAGIGSVVEYGGFGTSGPGNGTNSGIFFQASGADRYQTADFYIAGWWTLPSNTSDIQIYTIGSTTVEFPTTGLNIMADTISSTIYVRFNDGVSNITISAPLQTSGGRMFLAFARDEGNFKIYRGQGLGVVSLYNEVDTLPSIYNWTMIGSGYYEQVPDAITMVRSGTTVPTAQQFAQIYESEKQLFYPNTKYTSIGSAYSLDIRYTSMNKSSDTIRSRNVALSGATETIVQRTDKKWNVSSVPLNRETGALYNYTVFLDSVANGQYFTFDPYGSVATPNIPVTVVLESDSYSEGRVGPIEYYNVSFQMREI